MTVRQFNLPDLGEGLTDAEIVRWLVAVGDVIEVDQPVVEVVTAKASVELPCPYGGTVTALHHAEGDVVDVGSSLLSIADGSDASPGGPGDAGNEQAEEAPAAGAGEAIPGDAAAADTAAADAADTAAADAADATPAAAGAAEAAEAATPAGEAATAADPEGSSGSVLVGYGTKPEQRRRRRHQQAEAPAGSVAGGPAAQSARPNAAEGVTGPDGERPGPAVLSPVVRRLARELGVDLGSLVGSGPDGVIVRADVEQGQDVRAAPAVHSAGQGAGVVGPEPDHRIAIRGVHRQMADRLSRSRREIPEATVWVDADATGLLQARDALDAAHPERATGLGVTSLLARFCVLGLGRHPLLNSRIDDDEIVVSRIVNLGFAAQTERGLVVPVVRDAQQLTLLELDTEIRRLASAARQGALKSAEVTGGSFTVNNYGVFGVDGSAAIINFPEVAIVGIGRIMERPWVVDGHVRPRPVTELTLTFDHRVCDGGEAGGFLRFVADCVEQPLRLLAEG